MSLARTEEQQLLAGTVRSLLDKHSPSAAVRTAMTSGPGYDEALWRTLCEQVGVAALAVPEEYGGFGASLVETGVVLEELGANLAPNPLLATGLATAALRLLGTAEQRAALLPRIASGELATVVLDPGLVLEPRADLVLYPEPGGLRPADRSGAGLEPVEAVDPTLRLGRTAVSVCPPGPLVDVAATLVCALQVGAMQRGLDMTVGYTGQRVQFGRPIGSFQALKHRMADMLVLVEASRSASWAAVAAASAYVEQAGADRAEVLHERAAIARSYCSDALDQVAAETVQLHGGIAITWEHDAQLVFKRAHALAHLLGPAHRWRAAALD
ncbi:MAG: acyl-CoA dehydrogenase family protein [Marmoricola sp.]